MARLPTPGSDDGIWGGVLNDFLLESHKNDGSLKDGNIATAAIQDGAITAPKLAANNSPSNGKYLSYTGSSLTWAAPATSSSPQIFVQSTDPGASAQDGDIWVDTSS
jgi:hypothetical protein